MPEPKWVAGSCDLSAVGPNHCGGPLLIVGLDLIKFIQEHHHAAIVPLYRLVIRPQFKPAQEHRAHRRQDWNIPNLLWPFGPIGWSRIAGIGLQQAHEGVK